MSILFLKLTDLFSILFKCYTYFYCQFVFIYIIVIFLIFDYISFSNAYIITSYAVAISAISREKSRNFKMYKKELPHNGLSTRIQSSTNSSPYSSFA